MTKSLVIRWTDGAEYAEDHYPIDTAWQFHNSSTIVLTNDVNQILATYFIPWLISIRIEEDPTK